MLSARDVQEAGKALRGIIHQTPLDRSATFSAMAGCDVYLKLENLQKTGSFKIRGSYNKIRLLTPDESARGVIAASAGNHAQGVAYAARRGRVKATIVMPEAAPLAKITATRGYGAEVVLSGAGYDDAYLKAQEIQQQTGQTFVHAFDDDAVIAGQGTVGLEILEALADVTAIVVPIGGGGLIAGVALAVKEMAPHVKIYGVQSEGAPAVYMSKREHTIKTTPDAVTMADGIAVKVPGNLTFSIIDQYVDDVVVVNDEAIANTILMVLERAKLMVEGAGAVGLAAILNGKIPAGGKVASIISGGNIDVNFISRIIERGLVKAGRRVKITTLIADRPGTLQNLLAVITKLKANVIHVYHDRVERNVPIGQAVVEISLETRDALHTEEIMAGLRQQGYIARII
ncbi:threonine ammonia-lyase|uniref:L-threonine dehydratase catabolic TdcB n=1 Tax=Dendrosporobacter quercicolus TaxID=146817 RepID=A0A1G9QQB9_9FIRM|nr:threonine ammonia-lyase [Dendrosporobacter quercicolus]NSL48329.1 threonine ammonia-lyase [Dendrosporobacter quercicolus DSM 1736]SDM13242.1 threonine dehydratase [Dendrosporobacter quercicolus]